MSKNENIPLTIALFGDGGVGKTCVTLVFLYGDFVEDYEPTKTDSYRKSFNHNSKEYELTLIDTAGQEQYSHIMDNNVRTSDAIMLVFSLTDFNSFERCKELREQIQRAKDTEYPPIILIGNKLDVVTDNPECRKVSKRDAEIRAAQWKVPYAETSAKLAINIDGVFHLIIDQFLSTHAAPEQNLPVKSKKRKFKCSIL
ncbi:hypothetical protein HZS_6 [Henneguya salminicola]|nr:hypothetical protein HZS_6 [Henneguya salminicola]